jgi:hypothetical protein
MRILTSFRRGPYERPGAYVSGMFLPSQGY